MSRQLTIYAIGDHRVWAERAGDDLELGMEYTEYGEYSSCLSQVTRWLTRDDALALAKFILEEFKDEGGIGGEG